MIKRFKKNNVKWIATEPTELKRKRDHVFNPTNSLNNSSYKRIRTVSFLFFVYFLFRMLSKEMILYTFLILIMKKVI